MIINLLHMTQLSKIMSVTVMALLALASCTTSDEPGGRPEASPAHKIEISQKQKQTVMKGNKHAFDSWKTICRLNGNNDGNLFFSPISLQMALSLVANGADGDILNELIALYTEGNDEEGLNNLNELNKKLIEELPLVDKSAKLCFANSL